VTLSPNTACLSGSEFLLLLREEDSGCLGGLLYVTFYVRNGGGRDLFILLLYRYVIADDQPGGVDGETWDVNVSIDK
jgi:hypothetical protein